jgi:hypothetical protein
MSDIRSSVFVSLLVCVESGGASPPPSFFFFDFFFFCFGGAPGGGAPGGALIAYFAPSIHPATELMGSSPFSRYQTSPDLITTCFLLDDVIMEGERIVLVTQSVLVPQAACQAIA